ncbi:MAG: DNA mismatch repair protein MutS [Cyclobacteriaceae bacterium]
MIGSSKKRDQAILQSYQLVKKDGFDLDRISSYFLSKNSDDHLQVISDSTWVNLDFDEVFMYVDRTCSKVGEQYLYKTLRTIPKNEDRSANLEKIISFLDANTLTKEAVVLALSRLNKPSAYYLKNLFLGAYILKPKWFWVVPILSLLGVLTLILAFYFPVFWLVLVVILAINYLVHYWNKNNMMQYSNAVSQLLTLIQVTNKILHSGVPLENTDELQVAIKVLESIERKAVIFKMEAWAQSQLVSELGALVLFFVETIKALFLIEPLLLFNILEKLAQKKSAIETVYGAVGKVDVAISINSFREGLSYFCVPVFASGQKSICAKSVYHPLLTEPIANTIDISDGRSVLISGSNMSGKTTFIRTVGINTILAQTINTALAHEFTLPKIRVYSAIRIADDLLDDKSYYLEEVMSMNKLLRESKTDHQNLFLLDELFKGTNTLERVSIAKAVLSYLNQHQNLVFASTHDLELTEYLANTFNFFHFSEIIEDDRLTFDYLLKAGKLTKTNAIRILELNEYPEEVIQEAKTISKQISKSKEKSDTENEPIKFPDKHQN